MEASSAVFVADQDWACFSWPMQGQFALILRDEELPKLV
jgi:hypothetical protein